MLVATWLWYASASGFITKISEKYGGIDDQKLYMRKIFYGKDIKIKVDFGIL